MRSWPALEIRLHGPAPSHVEDWEPVQAALTDFDVAAIHEDAPDAWRVFFRTHGERDRAAAALGEQFPHLSVAPLEVPDEDWAARSQADLTSVRVGNIVVAPPWDAGAHGAGAPAATTIVIQPSMGFGTGHHATTRLCLAHLQRLDLRGRTLIDVGTGSGVLAIAASRLGAVHVLAIDDDPDAIQSARENVALNPGAEVTLGLVDLRRRTLRPFDVVAANLTGALLGAASGALRALAAPGGPLVLSGILEIEEPGVLQAFAACTIEHRSQEDEWVCVTLRSPS